MQSGKRQNERKEDGQVKENEYEYVLMVKI